MNSTPETKSNLSRDRKCRCSVLISEVSDILINAAEKLVCRLKKKCAQNRLDTSYYAIGKKYYDEISASPGDEYRPLVDAVNAAKGEIESLSAYCGSN